MFVKYLIGLIVSTGIFIMLFYSTKILGFFAYPILSPVICSVIVYKLTNKWWFGFASFFLIQVVYFGIYETINTMAGNRSFGEQLYRDFITNVEGRWALALHILALFISFITSIITYWWTKQSLFKR